MLKNKKLLLNFSKEKTPDKMERKIQILTKNGIDISDIETPNEKSMDLVKKKDEEGKNDNDKIITGRKTIIHLNNNYLNNNNDNAKIKIKCLLI